MHAILCWLLVILAWLRHHGRAWLADLFRQPRHHAWRAANPTRHRYAQPKPDWVRRDIIRLKALMPEAGCRTLAHHFNRRWAGRRQMTVGKTYVASTLSRHQHLIMAVRRKLKHRVPHPVPRNLIWGCDLMVKPDGQGRAQFVLALLDHASRAVLYLQRLPEKSSLVLLVHVIQAIRRYGTPRVVRTDNEACFTSACFRLGLLMLGITPQRIVPGCPWQNGRVERFFGTVKRALADEPITNGADLDAALAHVRQWYNHARPHDHLQGRTPAEVWAGVDIFAARSG